MTDDTKSPAPTSEPTLDEAALYAAARKTPVCVTVAASVIRAYLAALSPAKPAEGR